MFQSGFGAAPPASCPPGSCVSSIEATPALYSGVATPTFSKLIFNCTDASSGQMTGSFSYQGAQYEYDSDAPAATVTLATPSTCIQGKHVSVQKRAPSE